MFLILSKSYSIKYYCFIGHYPLAYIMNLAKLVMIINLAYSFYFARLLMEIPKHYRLLFLLGLCRYSWILIVVGFLLVSLLRYFHVELSFRSLIWFDFDIVVCQSWFRFTFIHYHSRFGILRIMFLDQIQKNLFAILYSFDPELYPTETIPNQICIYEVTMLRTSNSWEYLHISWTHLSI